MGRSARLDLPRSRRSRVGSSTRVGIVVARIAASCASATVRQFIRGPRPLSRESRASDQIRAISAYLPACLASLTLKAATGGARGLPLRLTVPSMEDSNRKPSSVNSLASMRRGVDRREADAGACLSAGELLCGLGANDVGSGMAGA